MSKNIDFYFDFSCPYAYLASTRVEALANRTGASLTPKPILLGGIFKAHDRPQTLYKSGSPNKVQHGADDLRRHATLWDVEMKMPEGHPLRTVTALRSLLVIGAPMMPLIHRFYEAYWVRGLDISEDDVVASILWEAGHDGGAVVARTKSDEIKGELRIRTDEALDLGIFGVPTFVVDGQRYWGQDRMDYVERAVMGTDGPEEAPPPADGLWPVDFYFDYSSPFSYVAAKRVRGWLGDAVRYKPMLLGGIFRAIGGPMVPLFEQPPSKQRYLTIDGQRQSARAGIDFSWPTRFPMNTVLALRVTLAAGGGDTEEGRALIERLFEAYWGEDRDISDRETVAAITDDLGLAGSALIAQTSDPDLKERLKIATAAAVEEGVFGAPTFVVHTSDGGRGLFWGNDCLPLVAKAAAGDVRLL